MQIFRDFADVHLASPTVLTIGTFDGLHLGHQYLISQLKTQARKHQAQSVVIAFHPRPKTVFAPHFHNNDYLTTADERIAQFEALEIDALILIPFTIEFSQTTAYKFVKTLVEQLGIVQLCVGHDFVLGKNREGDIEKLTILGREFNYTIYKIEPFLLNGKVVSSTHVRQHLLAGDVRQASHLLGRYPSLNGTIVQGVQRGRTIGFPTANFAVSPERLVPSNGVYATYVQRTGQEKRLASVTNVGVRPSFGAEERTVETYIFDFQKDIYGQSFTLEFVERLRSEKKFNGIESLVTQINQDVNKARAMLENEAIPIA